MYEPVHLLMITTNNNNKYYDMIKINDSEFEARYGRVGASKQVRRYPLSQWNKKYTEKIKKGYKDMSDMVAEAVEKENVSGPKEYEEIKNKVVADIINRLQNFAKKTVSENYKVKANIVTQKMIDSAQELLDSLVGFSGSVDEFNEKLLKLFTIIPRKMTNVNDFLVNDKLEFDKKIARESDILDTMRSQVYVKDMTNVQAQDVDEPLHKGTILDALGLEIEEATNEEVKKIKSLMKNNSDKFVRAYKVTHLESNKKFEKYCNDKNITHTELLWHGSRACNWFSILSQSLKIRPSGVVTNGALFGSEGIYFANNVMKSRNYCGMYGSYWVSGNLDTGFVALFETAYGDNPYDVYSFSSEYYNMNEERLNKRQSGATCLHAHAGTKLDGSWSSLKNDEIIFYNENAMTIRYLVEIS